MNPADFRYAVPLDRALPEPDALTRAELAEGRVTRSVRVGRNRVTERLLEDGRTETRIFEGKRLVEVRRSAVGSGADPVVGRRLRGVRLA